MKTGRPQITIQQLRDGGFLDELARVFDSEEAATSLLERADVPRERVRPWGQMTCLDFWESVCRELDKGLSADGPAALLQAAADLFPHNKTLQRVLNLEQRGDQGDPLPDDTVCEVSEGSAGDQRAPQPDYPDDTVRELSEALKDAYRRQEELVATGADTTAVGEEILDLRRKIREGGQLKAGDFLLDGRFRLIEQIGKGGFATVWKAFDRKDRLIVAVKVLHGQFADDKTRRERFCRGARQMARLNHQRIVRVVEQECEDGGFYFFVMEHLEGGDLRHAVLAGRLTKVESLQIVREVGEALAFAHDEGIIHRDVKPGNILLDDQGRAKLTDFDLVHVADTTGGTPTGMLGTFVYAAPEQMQGARDVGVPADIYSLGMTAIFALHGADLPPDVFRDAQGLIKSLDIDEALRATLLRAVEWDIEIRWDSVLNFCNRLVISAERYDLFISHSTQVDDPARRFVDAVAKEIENSGFSIFLDRDSSLSGTQLITTLDDIIGRSYTALLVVPATPGERTDVEWGLLRESQKRHGLSVTVLRLGGDDAVLPQNFVWAGKINARFESDSVDAVAREIFTSLDMATPS